MPTHSNTDARNLPDADRARILEVLRNTLAGLSPRPLRRRGLRRPPRDDPGADAGLDLAREADPHHWLAHLMATRPDLPAPHRASRALTLAAVAEYEQVTAALDHRPARRLTRATWPALRAQARAAGVIGPP